MVNRGRSAKEETFREVFKLLAPGTELREAVEQILSGRTGALIIIGDLPEVLKISDGGIKVDCPLTAARLTELTKMDGAILVDEKKERILMANVHLNPSPKIKTSETGMRHRTAERVSRQTSALAIAISQRRSIVSLYLKGYKYVLPQVEVLLGKANQALQTLERYRERFDKMSSNLTQLEFANATTLADVVSTIQRGEMAARIAREVERYIAELGIEGRLIKMQLEELASGLEEERLMLIKDYIKNEKSSERVLKTLANFSLEELLDPARVAQALGYDGDLEKMEEVLRPRGYRVLRKIPRLPLAVVNKIVEKFKSLQMISEATTDELDDVEGVGEVRAKAIQQGLERLREGSGMPSFFLEKGS